MHNAFVSLLSILLICLPQVLRAQTKYDPETKTKEWWKTLQVKLRGHI